MIEKYQDLEGVAGKLGIQNFSMKEAGGKVSISGLTPYQRHQDREDRHSRLSRGPAG